MRFSRVTGAERDADAPFSRRCDKHGPNRARLHGYPHARDGRGRYSVVVPELPEIGARRNG